MKINGSLYRRAADSDWLFRCLCMLVSAIAIFTVIVIEYGKAGVGLEIPMSRAQVVLSTCAQVLLFCMAVVICRVVIYHIGIFSWCKRHDDLAI